MNRKRVVLAFIYNKYMAVTMEELGISFIGSYLRKFNYEVKILSREITQLKYSEIMDVQPAVVGLTVYSYSIETVYEAAERLKAMNENIIICLGGVYATSNYQEILQTCPAVDYVFIGEGEISFLDFMNDLDDIEKLHQVSGLAYRSVDDIILTAPRKPIENLDELPFAARDIYVDKNYKVALMSTSRGCISSCSFCSSQLFWKKWRGRSSQNIVQEIEHLTNTYGLQVINFIDSSFEDPYKDLRRPLEIARLIIQKNIFISYFVNLRAEFYNSVSKEDIKLLKKSGMISVCIGIETANEEDLNLYNKRASLNDNEKVMDLLKENDISVSPGFINFNPYTTIDKLKKNLEFIYRYQFTILFFTKLSIYKGTNIYNKIESDQLLTDDKLSYHMADVKMEEFCGFFMDYKESLNQQYKNTFNIINFYYVMFPHTLKYYDRVLKHRGKLDSIVYIDTAKKELETILKDLNEILYLWISQSIFEYVKNESIESLKAVTAKILPLNLFVSYKDKMEEVRQRMFLSVTRAGDGDIIMLI